MERKESMKENLNTLETPPPHEIPTPHRIQARYEIPTRLEVWAEMERHLQQGDRLISSRIGGSPAHWQSVREDRGEAGRAFWEHQEFRAMHLPPRLTPAQRRAGDARFEEDARFEASEYLRWAGRHPAPGGSRWDWLGWGVVLLVAGIFFGERIPGVHEFIVHAFGL